MGAWNGYHSVPLHEDSKPLTTFITPWGHYWYNVNPQGQKVAGDAYSSRYDKILHDFKRKQNVVDDTCLYDWDVSKHTLHVCDFLTLTSNNGIIQNPEKIGFLSM